GSSTAGDRVPANVNSREMILTMNDQKDLLNTIRSGSGGGPGINLNLNIPAGATVDSESADRITGSMETLNSTLVQALEDGFLDTFLEKVQ
ncbi:unnamed protein product, partial [marine sediment metagenome]